jgi:hypothetical protein
MRVAFMLYGPGAGEAGVAEVRFRVRAAAGGEARADHDQLELTGNTL